MTDTTNSATAGVFKTGTVFTGQVETRHFADLNAASMKRLTGKPLVDLSILFVIILIFSIATIALFKLADVSVVKRQRGQYIGGAQIALIALLVGALLIHILYHYLAHLQNVRFRENALHQDGGFLGVRSYRFGDDGLYIETKYSASLSRWKGFTDLSDEPATLLLWTDPCAAIMVPKDALGDAAAIDAFKAAVMARIAG